MSAFIHCHTSFMSSRSDKYVASILYRRQLLCRRTGETAEQPTSAPVCWNFSVSQHQYLCTCIAGKDMMMKWKSIRDSYNRSLRLIKRKSGQKQKPMKTYVYAPYLTFLNATFTSHQTGTSLERASDKPVAGGAETQLSDDTEIEIIDDLEESSENSEERRKRKSITTNSYNRSKRKNLDNYLKNFQRKPQQKEGESNDDMDFFRSLIPIIKDLPVEEKIKFRIDIMKITLEYKQRFPDPTPIQQQPYKQRSNNDQIYEPSDMVAAKSIIAFSATSSILNTSRQDDDSLSDVSQTGESVVSHPSPYMTDTSDSVFFLHNLE
uniref:BESS domain-containing protein n=1 Tax=Timema monikensis TaxID=170555 RepID=A0A7R9EEL8_9NEOP|nr:unnamed protein product [Timema monikensis]